MSSNGLIVGGGMGFGQWHGEIPLTKANAGRPDKTYATDF
jgi:hypothetical protein